MFEFSRFCREGKVLDTTCAGSSDSSSVVVCSDGVRTIAGPADGLTDGPAPLAERLEPAGSAARRKRTVRPKERPGERGRHGRGLAETQQKLLLPPRQAVEMGKAVQEEREAWYV